MGRKIEVTVKLYHKDRKRIYNLMSSGRESVRVIKRAQILNSFHKGFSSIKISEHIGVTPETARRIAHRFNKKGLDHALYENTRPGAERALNQKQSSKIVALACSNAPEGAARWTLELLKTYAIKNKIIKTVGRETIRLLLHSHDIKPWREKNVVRAGT